jgi:hypothetical protein
MSFDFRKAGKPKGMTRKTTNHFLIVMTALTSFAYLASLRRRSWSVESCSRASSTQSTSIGWTCRTLRESPKPVSEKESQSAAIIPDTRLVDYSRNFARLRFINSESLVFNDRQFPKTGDIWAGQCARLSPDRSWIVLLSSSGTIAKRDEFLILGARDKGKLFLDFYNVETGKKLITVVGSYLDINPQALNQGLWVTEGYFILPLDAHRERSVVCDVGRVVRKSKD